MTFSPSLLYPTEEVGSSRIAWSVCGNTDF